MVAARLVTPALEPAMRLFHLLRSLFRRDTLENELTHELEFHVEMQTEANLRTGMAPEEARRQALIAFGGVERHAEACRDERGWRWLEALARDLRYAARRLAHRPGFSIPVVATLAVGIGAASAIFALTHGVLLRPLPYPEPDRLVSVGHAAPGLGIEEGGVSEGTFLHYRKRSRAFTELGLYLENDAVSLTDRGDPERIRVAMVTPGLLSVLGVPPALGRPFTEEDAAPEVTRVMVSHDLWRRRYGADPEIVGKTIEANRKPVEVVGVLPPGFHFPHRETQVWYAMGVEKSGARIGDLFYGAVGRLRDGVSPAAAEADLEDLIPRLADAYADLTAETLREAGLQPRVAPLKDSVVAGVRDALTVLLWAAGLVLVIVWANVGNLFLIRAERQGRELAVARALGAGGGALIRRSLAESLLLALSGGALGLAVAYGAVALRLGFEPGAIPRLHELRVDGVVVGVTAGLALLSGLVLGAAAHLRGARADLTAALRGASSRVAGGREWQRAQRLLVVVQVAFALALLVGSAVVAQSFWRLQHADLGFEPRGVLTFELSLPFSPYPTYRDAAAFHTELVERLRAVPGVDAAEASLGLPLTPAFASLVEPVAVDGAADGRGGATPMAIGNFATPDYFAAMGMPVLRGRGFRPGDLAGGAPPVVLSDALARALFGDADPVGQRVRLPGYPDAPAYAVIGVVGSVPGESIVDGPASHLYFPLLDDLRGGERSRLPMPWIPSSAAIVVRTSLPPTTLLSAVRRVLHEIDPKVPLARVRTMDQIVDASTARTRLTMLLLAVAAGAALFLGVVGLYGVVSYTVGERAREFGVRLALGCTPARLRHEIVRQGALLALGGIGAGIVVALALTRLLRGLLFQVSPSDPATFAAVAVLLLAIAALASYVPARRAARTDPVEALRHE